MATPIKSLFPPIEKKPFLLNKQQKSGSRRPMSCIDTYLGFFFFYPIPFMVVSSSSTSLPLNTIVYMLIIKLTSSNYLLWRKNYLLWRNQFILVLTSHDLLGFLDGSVSTLSPQITDFDGTT
jgi:hypothetical protein